MRLGLQILVATFNPFDRPLIPDSECRGNNFFAQEAGFNAKATTHLGIVHVDTAGIEVQETGQGIPYPVDSLR